VGRQLQFQKVTEEGKKMAQFLSGKVAVACFVVVLVPIAASAQIINTVAGGGPNGEPALSANLKNVWSVAFDKQGNLLAVSPNDYRVYRVDSSGNLTVFAGIGSVGFCGDGGPATSACLSPGGLSVDSQGNVFIADGYNAIREVSAGTGIIQTVAGQGAVQGFAGDGGPATGALLFAPADVCVDSAGNLFIADTGNDVVREVVAATGVIETVAGQGGLAGFAGDGGPAKAAWLNQPSRVALDSVGNLFIADTGNNVIREVVARSGEIQTVAGVGTVAGFSGDGGPATRALLASPMGVTIDGAGNILIADTANSVVREVSAATHTIQTIAGNGQTNGYSGDGGQAANALLAFPAGVTLDAGGNLFISDSSNNAVREVAAATGTIKTFAGNGYFGFSGDGRAATVASLQSPSGVFVDANGDLFIADLSNDVVREVSAETGDIQTVAGTPGKAGYNGDGGDAKGALLHEPGSIILDAAGNLFIADEVNRVIRKVNQGTGKISTVAGGGSATCPNPALPNETTTTGAALGDGGPATSATLCWPGSIALDKQGNLYIPDEVANLVREVFGPNSTAGTPGDIISIAGTGTRGYSGDGGPATMAELAQPRSVAVDGAGNVFIADSKNGAIREVAATGTIRTVAGVPGTFGYSGDGGPATSALLRFPSAVSVDAAGDLFILDTNNNVVRMVAGNSGIIDTIVGQQRTSTGYLNPGFGGDGGAPTSAFLNFPMGLFVAGGGNIFIADTMNNRVREVSSTLQPTFALSAQSLDLTIPKGAYTTDVLTITPMFGAFNSAILLTCSVSGTAAPTCSVSPSSTVPGAQDTNLILTVQAPSTMASLPTDTGGSVLTWAYVALLPALAIFLFGLRRGSLINKPAAALGLLGCVIFLAVLPQAGCGGSRGSQSTVPLAPVSYTVIVTASSASVTRTVSIDVTLQ
jgi:trimeric autotransporter adhesin